MKPRVPEIVQPLLQMYTSLVNQSLPGLMSAFYIVGSIALGEFNEYFSDVDFVAVLSRRANEREIERLRQVHRQIEKAYPRWKMSGSYLQPEDLGRFDGEVEPYPHYHEGILRPRERSALNSVTWWELKNHGIAVFGPEPQTLPFLVNWVRLVANMRENLNTYWASWTKRPDRIIILWSDWGIQWAVLGALRQFYTFRENSITTKKKAGEYALTYVQPRWHSLIQEAIRIRDRHRKSFYRSRIVRLLDAVRFLRYIILTCNEQFPGLM